MPFFSCSLHRPSFLRGRTYRHTDQLAFEHSREQITYRTVRLAYLSLRMAHLSVDSALERPSSQRDLVLGEGKLVSVGDSKHLLHDVEAGDALRDRMLYLKHRERCVDIAGEWGRWLPDLKTCVHLEEVEVLLRVDEKFHGSGRVVAYSQRQRTRCNRNCLLGLDVEEIRSEAEANGPCSPILRRISG